jgi:hypothetical protein
MFLHLQMKLNTRGLLSFSKDKNLKEWGRANVGAVPWTPLADIHWYKLFSLCHVLYIYTHTHIYIYIHTYTHTHVYVPDLSVYKYIHTFICSRTVRWDAVKLQQENIPSKSGMKAHFQRYVYRTQWQTEIYPHDPATSYTATIFLSQIPAPMFL